MNSTTSGLGRAPRRRTEEALKRKADRIAALVAEGMSEEDAAAKVQEEMRDNDKGDWRRG